MAESSPITITPKARESLVALRAQDPEPDKLAVRVAVTGERDGRYLHDMSFELLADAGPGDAVFEHDDLPLIVPGDSVAKLHGATLDLAEGGQGWTIENPNRPKRMLPLAPAGGHQHAGHAHERPASPVAEAEVPEELRETLSGGTAQKIAEVLERHINPSIAMHGGHAELVGVKDAAVYLRLSGGCQGCSMAAVTLRQGIERAITDLVPEITEIVDVTDHASGTDPYFQSSKG